MATPKSLNGSTEAVARLVKEDEAKGMAVHIFDPHASPAEKAAAAGKARDQVKSVKVTGPADGGARGEFCWGTR